MKVLQINSVSGIGSTGRIAVDLSKVIVENNDECVIAYGRESLNNSSNQIRIGTRLNNYIALFMTRYFDRHGLNSFISTKTFIKKIKKCNPDIIHVHNIHGYYINYKLLFNYLGKSNIPIVWTLHDCWAFTGHCAYFDLAKCDKWTKQCYKCENKSEYPRSRFIDRSSKNYIDKKRVFNKVENLIIVTPSKWLEKLVRKSFLSNATTMVINNGIDLDKFKPGASEFKKKMKIEGKFVILGVASIWDKRKGLEDFIKLARLLTDEFQIVIVGLTKDQLENIPQNIVGINRTNSIEELVGIYRDADVFFNPTYEDNFPTTNLEALACGTPVITYDTGGSPEAITEKTGMIIPVGNIPEVLACVINMGTHPYDSERCVDRAKKFDKDLKFQEYVSLYKKIGV